MFVARIGALQRNARAFGATALFTLGAVAFHSSVAESQARRTSASRQRADPKCAFLRSETTRIGAEGQAFVDSSSLAAPPDSAAPIDSATLAANTTAFVAATERFAARQTIAQSKADACRAKRALLDEYRMPALESLRAKHVARASARLDSLLGSHVPDAEAAVIQAINAEYDSELRSFSSVPAGGAMVDRDVAKEYSTLPSLIQASTLDEATKRVLVSGYPLLRFHEAGRLANVLSGVNTKNGLGYAYTLRKTLGTRADSVGAAIAAAADSASRAQASARRIVWERRIRMATRVGVMVVIAAVVLLPVMLYVSYLKARYRAFKTGAKRVPVFGGAMELILWNPGETVVLLRNKVLEPANPDFRKGGITRISAWSGEEYKGFISSKTELLAWKSDQIHTSDGLPIQLHLNVWWHIAEPQKYVSRIATYYRDDAQPGRKPLSEAPGPDNPLHRAAAEWIMKLTAATVREQVNKLPAEKLISPHAQSFIPVADGTRAELGLTFRTQISDSASELRLKTAEYGLVVERLEVQELLLPPGFQDKLEELRQAFMEPTKAYQQAAANKVRGQAAADVRLYELGGLANIIGADGVRAKEVLKEVNFAGMSNPMIAMTPMFDPMREAIRQTAAAGLAADKKDSGDAGTNRQIEGGANAGPPADPPKSP